MSLFRLTTNLLLRAPPTLVLSNQVHRWVRPTLFELASRRKKVLRKNQGKLPVVKRSEFIDFNYESEVFAFGNRIRERINHALLTQAFVDRSYIVQEEMKQKAVGVEEPVLNLQDNSSLAAKGEELMTEFIISFLNLSLPTMPREGIKCIFKHLMSDDVLKKVSMGLGTKDLILSADYPPTKQNYEKTLKAIIGAIFESSGEARAYEFIRDFICTQLNQVDVNEFWKIENPVELLKEICADKKVGVPEPRLIGQMGKNTILAANFVGFYANKKCLGTGFGENIETAVEEAAKDSLRNFFKTNVNMKPINFKLPVEKVMQSLNKPAIAAASVEKLM